MSASKSCGSKLLEAFSYPFLEIKLIINLHTHIHNKPGVFSHPLSEPNNITINRSSRKQLFDRHDIYFPDSKENSYKNHQYTKRTISHESCVILHKKTSEGPGSVHFKIQYGSGNLIKLFINHSSEIILKL